VSALEAIARAHEGVSVVVVTHGLVLDALYRTACRMSYDIPRGFPLLNCSLNTFRLEAGSWVAHAVCDVSHLAEADVTRFSDAKI
jgi:probable phosphoglycerate mutase